MTDAATAMARVCCHTAAHGLGCPCWRCVCLAITDELQAATESEAPDLPEARPAPSPTSPKRKSEAPEVVIEALMYCYRERGRAAFLEPRNRTRLADLSSRQRQELRARVQRIKQAARA